MNLGPNWIRSAEGTLVNIDRVTEIRIEYDGFKYYVSAHSWESPSGVSRWAVLKGGLDSRAAAQTWLDEHFALGVTR